jgi:hypothetical protein
MESSKSPTQQLFCQQQRRCLFSLSVSLSHLMSPPSNPANPCCLGHLLLPKLVPHDELLHLPQILFSKIAGFCPIFFGGVKVTVSTDLFLFFLD